MKRAKVSAEEKLLDLVGAHPDGLPFGDAKEWLKYSRKVRRLLREVLKEAAERGRVAGRETCSCCGGRRVHPAGEAPIRAAILSRPTRKETKP